jgi:hypothetical protein
MHEFEEWGYAERAWYVEGKAAIGGIFRLLFWPTDKAGKMNAKVSGPKVRKLLSVGRSALAGLPVGETDPSPASLPVPGKVQCGRF